MLRPRPEEGARLKVSPWLARAWLRAPVSKGEGGQDRGGLVLRDASQRSRACGAARGCVALRCSSDRMSLPLQGRLTLDAVARVTRIGRAEPQARRVSHERS